MLARIHRVNAEIARLSEVIERLLAPYEEQLQQAESMPGWGRRAAEDALAETGTDIPGSGPARTWSPGPGAPRWTTPPARAEEGLVQEGYRSLGGLLQRRPPFAAGKTQTREGARYRRLSRRRGKAKALVAVGNTQLKVFHTLLSSPGMRYQDLGPDYYERRAEVSRQVRHHVGKLGALGFTSPSAASPDPDPNQAEPRTAKPPYP